MAKKKVVEEKKQSKAGVIRDLISQFPGEGNIEIAKKASAILGEEVLANYVSMTKSNDKKADGGMSSGGKVGPDTEKEAMMFVLQNGGNVAKSLDALSKLEDDPLLSFVLACGGADKAEKALSKLKEQLAK